MKQETKLESFKIERDLMNVIRQFAKADGRSIKTTIERTLRERFMSKKP